MNYVSVGWDGGGAGGGGSDGKGCSVDSDVT